MVFYIFIKKPYSVEQQIQKGPRNVFVGVFFSCDFQCSVFLGILQKMASRIIVLYFELHFDEIIVKAGTKMKQ